ncbi:hypothetical protein Echvi_0798 [Echinicola vietnamensis DSM 17526]|uniref:Uncharacterized protein n=1 Tax=Echinicola vietnamensis (strain DSM 17526 / LMG 23754 / KMM 6221) TaxID=926556 RepID=L0FVN9_ECHVK|nr:hypothetical protein Echvi_0798 [Echinicola vietnamensis DSM 17526]
MINWQKFIKLFHKISLMRIDRTAGEFGSKGRGEKEQCMVYGGDLWMKLAFRGTYMKGGNQDSC